MPRKEQRNGTVTVSFRIDKARLQQIERFRVHEHRSRAQFVQLAVEEHLDRRLDEERKKRS